MKYLSIGNEDVGHDYFVRYKAIAKAVRARHPEIRLIAAAHRANERDQGYPAARQALAPDVADILDEHFYFSRDWLEKDGARFDCYPRKQRLAVTEYAHKERGMENTRPSALLDMAFLLNLLRNADLVEMTSYAPLLAWKGKENWSPNLIEFDGRVLTLTPNYHVQKFIADNLPEEVVPVAVENAVPGFHCVCGRRGGSLSLICVNLSDRRIEVCFSAEGRRRGFSMAGLSYGVFGR